MAQRFVAAEVLLPQAVVDNPARWATWRRLDRLLNEALAAGDMATAEVHVAEAERWAREARATATAKPKGLSVPATCLACGGGYDGTLYTVRGQDALKCGACGTWEFVSARLRHDRGGAA